MVALRPEAPSRPGHLGAVLTSVGNIHFGSFPHLGPVGLRGLLHARLEDWHWYTKAAIELVASWLPVHETTASSCGREKRNRVAEIVLALEQEEESERVDLLKWELMQRAGSVQRRDDLSPPIERQVLTQYRTHYMPEVSKLYARVREVKRSGILRLSTFPLVFQLFLVRQPLRHLPGQGLISTSAADNNSSYRTC